MANELNKNQIKEQKKKSKDKTSFGKQLKNELKKVVWPKPAELVKSTIAVIAIVIVISVIVFALDFVFESMNKYGIDKIKDAVQTTEEKNNDSSENNDESTENENNQTDSTETLEENTAAEESNENIIDENVQN